MIMLSKYLGSGRLGSFLVPLRCRENTPCAGLEDEVHVCSLLSRDDLPEGDHSSDLTCYPLAFCAL